MDIIKQNEGFTLSDASAEFEANGNIIRETSGTLHINFIINKIGGDYVGDCNYNKYVGNDVMNFNVRCPEDEGSKVISYASTLVSSALEHIKSLN